MQRSLLILLLVLGALAFIVLNEYLKKQKSIAENSAMLSAFSNEFQNLDLLDNTNDFVELDLPIVKINISNLVFYNSLINSGIVNSVTIDGPAAFLEIFSPTSIVMESAYFIPNILISNTAIQNFEISAQQVTMLDISNNLKTVDLSEINSILYYLLNTNNIQNCELYITNSIVEIQKAKLTLNMILLKSEKISDELIYSDMYGTLTAQNSSCNWNLSATNSYNLTDICNLNFKITDLNLVVLTEIFNQMTFNFFKKNKFKLAVDNGIINANGNINLEKLLIQPSVLFLSIRNLVAEFAEQSEKHFSLAGLKFNNSNFDIKIPIDNNAPYFHFDEALNSAILSGQSLDNLEINIKL